LRQSGLDIHDPDRRALNRAARWIANFAL